jgi:hypothetical protein
MSPEQQLGPQSAPRAMPILRLAYATLFLLALLAVFFLWSEVGGQTHLDLMPWYLKLVLGTGAAFAVVKATVAAVGGKNAWNGGTLRWLGILAVLLTGCGLASYYVHLYGEDNSDDQDDTVSSEVYSRLDTGVRHLPAVLAMNARPGR